MMVRYGSNWTGVGVSNTNIVVCYFGTVFGNTHCLCELASHSVNSHMWNQNK